MERDNGRFKKGVNYYKLFNLKDKIKLGKDHPSWKGGKKDVNGYTAIYNPEHPRASRKYVYEHIVVAEAKIGRSILHGEQVHHINGDRKDNSPDNLVVCKNQSEHLKHHRIDTWALNYDKCISCGTTERHYAANGMCYLCYQKTLPKSIGKPCIICGKQSVGFKYCMNHYRHFKKYGNPFLTKDSFRRIIDTRKGIN